MDVSSLCRSFLDFDGRRKKGKRSRDNRENGHALETVRQIKFKNERQLDGQTMSIPPEMTLSAKNGSWNRRSQSINSDKSISSDKSVSSDKSINQHKHT